MALDILDPDHQEDEESEDEDEAPAIVMFPWGELRHERRDESTTFRHFKSFVRLGDTFKLGDVCLLDSNDENVPHFIGKLVDLWDEGPGTQQWCNVRWFFRPNSDVGADAQGLREWRRALRELPLHKRAHKEKQVFISYNEQRTDMSGVEDENELQTIIRKVNMVCTGRHPRCREPSAAEVAGCEHWFNSSYCASPGLLVNSLTGVLRTLSAELLFNNQYLPPPAPGAPEPPPPQAPSDPAAARPAEGVLRPSNYKASGKAKRYASDSDSDDSDTPLATKKPAKKVARPLGDPPKPKVGASGSGGEAGAKQSVTGGSAEGKAKEGVSASVKLKDGAKGVGLSQPPKLGKPTAEGGEKAEKKLKLLKKVREEGGSARPVDKDPGQQGKDSKQVYEKLLEERRALLGKKGPPSEVKEAKARTSLDADLAKKVALGLRAREKEGSVLGKRPAEERVVPKTSSLNAGGAERKVQKVGEIERPAKVQKVGEGARPLKAAGDVDGLKKGVPDRPLKIQKPGDAKVKPPAPEKDSERPLKMHKPEDVPGKRPAPAKGSEPGLGVSVKKKLGLKKPDAKGGVTVKKKAVPKLTAREQKAELLRGLDAPPPPKWKEPVLESASDSSDSETSSSEDERPIKGGAQKVLTKQGSGSLRPEGGAVKDGDALKKGDMLKKSDSLKKSDPLKRNDSLQKSDSLKRSETLIKSPSLDNGALQKGDSLKKSDSFKKSDSLTRNDSLKKSDSFKASGAAPPKRSDTPKSGPPAAPPKKPELQKQGSGKRPAVSPPEHNPLQKILSGMTSTFRSKGPSYEENDEEFRPTKVKWADPLTHVRYFQESPHGTPEGAGSGAYAALPGGDFLTKRYRQQHGEVKKEELLRVKDELRRLEERDFQESPVAPADDWLPAASRFSEEPGQVLSGGANLAGWEAGVSVQKGEDGGGLASSSGIDAAPKGASVLEARKPSPEIAHVVKGSPRPRSPLGIPPGGPVQGADGTERKPSPSRLGVPPPERKASPSPLGDAQPERKPSPSSVANPQPERKPSPSLPSIASSGEQPSPTIPPATQPGKKASPFLGINVPARKPPQSFETAPSERKSSPSPLGPPPPAAPPPPPPPPGEAAPAPPQKVVAVAPPQKAVAVAPPQKEIAVAKKPLPQKQASFDEAMRTQMGKAEQERRELAEMFAREKKKVEDQVERTRELAGNTYHPTMRKSAISEEKAAAERKRRALLKKLEQKRVLQLDNLALDSSPRQLLRSLAGVFPGLEDVEALPSLRAEPHVAASALAIFDTRESAAAAALKLRKYLICVGDPPRPVLGRRVQPMEIKNKFAGPISIGRPESNSHYQDKINAIAVAHASQPNTVEFEFGAEWRLLQLRHAEQDRLLAQIHAKQIEELETKYREERKKLGLDPASQGLQQT